MKARSATFCSLGLALALCLFSAPAVGQTDPDIERQAQCNLRCQRMHPLGYDQVVAQTVDGMMRCICILENKPVAIYRQDGDKWSEVNLVDALAKTTGDVEPVDVAIKVEAFESIEERAESLRDEIPVPRDVVYSARTYPDYSRTQELLDVAKSTNIAVWVIAGLTLVCAGSLLVIVDNTMQ